MRDTTDRNTCFDYLLDRMDEEDRMRFEARLSFDDALAAELRQCEADLADFAEAASDRLEPSGKVWAGICARVAAEEPALAAPVAYSGWRRSWPWVWPVAASVLLGLNVWQYRDRTDSSAQMTARPERAVEFSAEEHSAQVAAQVQDELSRLQAQVAELKQGAGGGELESPATEETLLERRRVLEERVDALEVYYLSLLDYARRAADDALALEGTLDNGRVRASLSENLASTSAPDGLWARVATELANSPLVVLAYGVDVTRRSPPSNALIGGGGSAVGDPKEIFVGSEGDFDSSYEDGNAFAPGGAEGDPVAYAMALVDGEARHAILTMGGLPFVDDQESLVLWLRHEETGAHRRLAELPGYLQGSSSSLALRLPEDFPLDSDFLVSVESSGTEVALREREGVGSTVAEEAEGLSATEGELPSERVVLRTQPTP